MTDKPLLPSDIVTASQARIAAALAVRQEIERLTKIADELDAQALQDLTDLAGPEGAERLRERMLEAFEQSGVPQESLDTASQLTGAMSPRQTTSANSTPTSVPVATDEQSANEDAPITPPIEMENQIPSSRGPSIPAAPVTIDTPHSQTSFMTEASVSAATPMPESERDLADSVIEICGFHLTGKMVESGRKIAAEASEQVASGSRSPASRYDRCFGRHAWQKDLYHAAFDQALSAAGAPSEVPSALPTPPAPPEYYQDPLADHSYMPWENPDPETEPQLVDLAEPPLEDLLPAIQSQDPDVRPPAVIESNVERAATSEDTTINLSAHIPDQILVSGWPETPDNEIAEDVARQKAIIPPTQHSPGLSSQRRQTTSHGYSAKHQTTAPPEDEEDIVYGAENEAHLEEFGDDENYTPGLESRVQLQPDQAHIPASHVPITPPSFLRASDPEPNVSFHRIAPPPPPMPRAPPKYAKGL